MNSTISCDLCLIMKSTKIKNTLKHILPKCVISVLCEHILNSFAVHINTSCIIINSREIKTFILSVGRFYIFLTHF